MSPVPVPANEIEYLFKIKGETSDGDVDLEFHVLQFHAREALSDLYRLELDLSYPDVELDLSGLVGKNALLTMQHEEGERHIHGIVARIEEREEGPVSTCYRVVVVPRMWLLGHKRNSRIFQEMSTIEILEEVFGEVGITPGDNRLEIKLDAGAYSPRDYCAQYRETDLAFVRRLMEEDGICFYFTHSADDSAEEHTLVLADTKDQHAPVEDSSILFEPPSTGGLDEEQNVWQFRQSQQVRSGKAVLDDYNFKQPTQDLKQEAFDDLDSDLVVYDYPGEFVDSGIGSTLTERRYEELQVARFQGAGQSNARRLESGFIFELVDHPNDWNNREWLVTEVLHFGRQSEPGAADLPDTDAGGRETRYRNQFKAIPADVQYRPARNTPRPVVAGLQTARVTGPEGEEIHVDEFGRVKVKFHWDQSDEQNENSSCWIRVSHAWAGAGFGHVFLPRIDQEVIVQFIEGDIDRPLVTGRVYNGDNKHPYNLPAEKTKSTMKTDTSPHDGGFNEMRFEDKAGQEEIYVHAQKDQNEQVNNDHTQNVDHDQTMTVKNNRTRTVTEGDELVTIETGKQTINIDTGGQFTTIQNTREVTVNSGGETIKVTGLHDETITGNANQHITGTLNQTVDTAINIITPSYSNTELDKRMTFTPMRSQTTGILNSNFGVRLSIRGLDTRLTGLKIDTVGLLFGNKGVYIESKGVDLEKSGCSLKTKALSILTAGLIVRT